MIMPLCMIPSFQTCGSPVWTIQRVFRAILIRTYNESCMISGCTYANPQQINPRTSPEENRLAPNGVSIKVLTTAASDHLGAKDSDSGVKIDLGERMNVG